MINPFVTVICGITATLNNVKYVCLENHYPTVITTLPSAGWCGLTALDASRDQSMAGGIQHRQAARLIGWHDPGEIPGVKEI
jgi:hypothetical protein